MELLFDVAIMKCVRLLVASKQQITSVRAEGTNWALETQGDFRISSVYSKFNHFYVVGSQSW